ncbi:glycosyltransferase family 25 protein [Veillonella sp. VA141]|uniref:glycosyltransferase family 25 protein n=1 Tax=Veillonella sp. VA141 TaxID=741833 RepID=UPI000F8E16AA|nr:glycosyltransferase family 25 protein [Veillonella sp. VA141]
MLNYTIISDALNRDRRESIKDIFKGIGINEISFTEAIMATRMSDIEVYSHTIENSFLTKGEVGCVLSHKKIYETFLNSEEKSIIIFEEDVLFTEMCNIHVLEQIVNVIDTIEAPVVVALQKGAYNKKERFRINNEISIFSSYKFYSTVGYIINRAAAKIILEIQTPIRFEMDAFEYYCWLGDLQLYCLNENLVIQNPEFDSVIGDERFLPSKWRERMEKRDKIYNDLYKRLSIMKKLQVGIKHFRRVLYERVKRYTR